MNGQIATGLIAVQKMMKRIPNPQKLQKRRKENKDIVLDFILTKDAQMSVQDLKSMKVRVMLANTRIF